jgi:tetratricopeptide (TPR) repeat protein
LSYDTVDFGMFPLLALVLTTLLAATYETARAEFEQGRYEAALAALESLSPEAGGAAAQNLKALALAQLRRYNEAIEAIARARRLDGNNLSYAYNAGLILYDAGRLEESSRVFEDALRRFGPSAPLLAGLGEVQFRSNRFAGAERSLQQALALEPRNLAARIVLARLFRATGQAERFEAAAREALAIDARNPQACYYYGLARLDAGDRPAAVEYIRRSLDLQPGFAEALKSWGQLLGEDGKWGDALRAYEQAAHVDADDAETLYLLATAYRKTGQADKAAQALARYRERKR